MNIACSSCLLPSFSFTIFGKTMNYCHCTGLKNKNGSLCLHDSFFSIHKRTCYKLECTCIFCHITATLPCSNLNGAVHIFLGKPEMWMNSSTSMRNNTYLLILQANCATIWCEKCDNSWLALTIKFVFLQESLSKVLTNQNMFSKQNQMSMFHRGWQWAFKSKGFFSKKKMLQKIVLNLLWTPNDLDPWPVWNIELAVLHGSSTTWFQMSCYCYAKLNSWIVIKNM